MKEQADRDTAILPPTRFFYIGAAYAWHYIWGTGPCSSLTCAISSLCSMLLLGPRRAFRVAARRRHDRALRHRLMAVAPTQIHMSQHALIDGVFAFWATFRSGCFGKICNDPTEWPWLGRLTGSALAVMVLTKENAMFAYLQSWRSWPRITGCDLDSSRSSCWFATLVGPFLGLVFLVMLSRWPRHDD